MRKKWLAVFMCGVMAAGVSVSQIGSSVAKQECTCQVEVHGSNCPLSKCTCHQEEHTQDCPLYGAVQEMTTCICEPEIHAKGCPRYVEAAPETGEGTTAAPEQTTPEQTTPEQTTPEQTAPEQTAPEETVPEKKDDGKKEDASAETDKTEEVKNPETAEKAEKSEQEETEQEEIVKEEASKEETILLTYRLQEGLEGTLSFEEKEIHAGEAVGDRIPSVDIKGVAENIRYLINDTWYNGTSLAEYQPTTDTVITVYALSEAEDGAGQDAEYWEKAPDWAGNGEHVTGNLLTVAQLLRLENEQEEYVQDVKNTLNMKGNVEMASEDADIEAVMAVYAAVTDQTENFPYDVELKDEESVEELRSIYWTMTQTTGVSNTEGAAIYVSRLDISEAAEILNLTEKQTQQAEELWKGADQKKFEDMLENSALKHLTEEELNNIEQQIPSDISSERKAVLMAALSLEGKIEYFWGGKSPVIGWNPYWGEKYVVTSDKSKQTGKVCNYGLDCSGFITWCMVNATGDEDIKSYIGEGTAEQYRNSQAVDWDQAKPGDLVFYKNPAEQGINHVGIVLTVTENGPEKVVHCSLSGDGVEVTDAAGFKYVRTPYLYQQ